MYLLKHFKTELRSVSNHYSKSTVLEEESPASSEKSSETFSILAFLSAGGAAIGGTAAGVSAFCNKRDSRDEKASASAARLCCNDTSGT